MPDWREMFYVLFFLSQIQKTEKVCPKMASLTSCLCTTTQSRCLRLVEKLCWVIFLSVMCFFNLLIKPKLPVENLTWKLFFDHVSPPVSQVGAVTSFVRDRRESLETAATKCQKLWNQSPNSVIHRFTTNHSGWTFSSRYICNWFNFVVIPLEFSFNNSQICDCFTGQDISLHSCCWCFQSKPVSNYWCTKITMIEKLFFFLLFY